MKLRNLKSANAKLATAKGVLPVDADGCIETEDKDVARSLYKTGWEFVGPLPVWLVEKVTPIPEAPKPEAPKPEAPKEEDPKEEDPEPEKVVEEPKEEPKEEKKSRWQRSKE